MQNQEKTIQMRLRRMIGVAIFTALAYVVMLLIHFPVSFLTLDAKDAVITLCGLCFGPLAALFSAVAVPLLEMVTVSSTGVYGFLMNAIGTASFAVTVSLIYKYRRNFLGAIIGLLSGVCVMTAVMMLFNLIVTPKYMHVDVAVVKNMIPKLLLPFNLVKAVFNAAVVLLLYKPVSTALQRTGFLPQSDAKLRWNIRTIVVTVVAVVLMVGSLIIVFRVLHGSFRFGV